MGGALLAALLVPATSAQGYWHLRFSQAHAATNRIERRICTRDNSCIAYGATCARVSESHIDCNGGTIYDTEVGELECLTLFHWGVTHGGQLKFRAGRPHCHYLE